MSTANLAQTVNPIVAKTITIKDIELRTQAWRKLQIARQYEVEFSVGATSQLTRKAKETKNGSSWDETLFFDGDDCSVLLVKVHRMRHIGKVELVGRLNDTIGGVLGKLKDGVLEEPLPITTSDSSDSSGITIKFALAAEPLGDVNADERQSTDAVIRETEMAFETKWGELSQKMEHWNSIVAGITQVHPHMLQARPATSAVNRLLVDQSHRDDQIIGLAGTMSDVFRFLQDAEPLKATRAYIETIMLLIQQVTDCGNFITEYAKQREFSTRVPKYMHSDIDAKIMHFEDKFQELKTALLETVAVQTGVTVIRMMNVVEHTAEAINLNDLPYAFGAGYVLEKGCLPGTREALLRDICDILNNPDADAPRVCLLTGVAGSGKSAVAHSIARLYDWQMRLGSSYFFATADVAGRNPQNLFSTIARDLSDHDPQYRHALCGVVKNNRMLRTSTSPLMQIQRLIIEPCEHLHAIGPTVIVIDALDESGDQASRRPLLRAVSKQISENSLPANLRFLITARPESDILSAFSSCSHLVHKQMSDLPHDVVDGDIQKFILHSLHQYTELESSWPDQEWCRLLVHHSQHLFQWASNACNFIEGFGSVGLNPRKRLEKILQNDKLATDPLDELYRTILGQLFTLSETRQSFQDVMAVVLALKEPLSLTSLSTLFESDEELNVRDIIKPMGSLLDGVLDEEKPIHPLHTSFYDFLLDEVRSSIFHVHIQL